VSVLRNALLELLSGRTLDAAQTEAVFHEILDGALPQALVAAFLVALRMKGEQEQELTGAARALRARARTPELGDGELLDTAGTGGDGAGTFNISTGAALVAAAAGVRVAKHGNRAISGAVGAADLLERFGVRIELAPAQLKQSLELCGFCFIFAPAYHPVLKSLAGLRRTLGIRTAFNLAAPLANPALPARQLLGVAEARLVLPMAQALRALETRHALVVHSADGLDELSLGGPTTAAEVRGDAPIRQYQVRCEEFGLAAAESDRLRAASADQAAALMEAALSGRRGPARDVLALNGGAAIYVGGRANSLAQGVALAARLLDSGRPWETLQKVRAASLEEEP
jgi:anthranilate phosphoribosyltransferase